MYVFLCFTDAAVFQKLGSVSLLLAQHATEGVVSVVSDRVGFKQPRAVSSSKSGVQIPGPPEQNGDVTEH